MRSDPDPNKLTIQLLGPPQVNWQGTTLQISRRQARAVLYRLAADLHPVSREQLAFLIWSDVPEATARRNLVRLLSYLRKMLPHPDCLITSRNSVQLNPDWAESDCQTMVRLNAIGDVAVLTAVPDLYLGSFLAGFSLPDSLEFENWCAQTAVHFEQLYLAVLHKLIIWHMDRDEQTAAIAYAQRYLAIDELAEEIHRHLISLYGLVGDRTAVTRQFEQCSLILERELGVSPLPVTRAAYDAALRGLTTSRSPQPVAPNWSILPSLDLPLVGRDAALQTVTQAATQLTSSGLILISGEPGVGKSRILQAFALSSGWSVLTGNSHLATLAIPYQPLVEALRQTLHEPLLWHNIQPIWMAEVSRLLPEMREYFPDLPQPVNVEPEQAQARLFEGLTHCFFELGTDKINLLCLDDLHWADTATLHWLISVTSRISNSRLRIMATYRSGEAKALTDVKRSFRRANCLAEVQLNGLTQEAICQVLHGLDLTWSEEIVWALAGRLHQATGGNTFFVLETIRTLLEGDNLDGPPETLPLAATVEEAVRLRLEQLTAVSQQLLQAAAVLSPNLQPMLIQRTAGRTDLELVDALDELTSRHLLRETDNGFHFSHDLVRTAVYQEITPWRRKMLHRRAAESIGQIADSGALQQFTSIAQHYDAAGEFMAAIQAYQKAASAAQTVYAYKQAVAHLQKAIRLLPSAEMNPALSVTLYETLADNLATSGHFGLAEKAYRQAIVLVPDDQKLQLTELEFKLATTLPPQQRQEEAEGIYRSALARLDGSQPVATSQQRKSIRLDILLGLLDALYFQLRHQAMEELKERTQILLDDVGTIEQQAQYYDRLNQISFIQNRYCVPDKNIPLAKKTLDLVHKSGSNRLIARQQFHFGFQLLWHDDLDDAEDTLQQALTTAKALGDSWLHTQCLTYLTILYRLQGNKAQMSGHLTHLEEISRQIDNKIYIGVSQANRAWLHYRTEEWHLAQTQAEAALTSWLKTVYPMQWLAHFILLAVCQHKGKLKKAIESVESLLDTKQQQLPEMLVQILEEAVAHWRLGELEKADDSVQTAIKVALEIGYL